MGEFRETLHAWAVQQLTKRAADYVGPFEVTAVRVDSVRGYSVGSDYLQVSIAFVDGAGGEQCWFMPDTTDTVEMINQLLALGDR